LVLLNQDFLNCLLAEVFIDFPLEDMPPHLFGLLLDGLINFFNFLAQIKVGIVSSFVIFLVSPLGKEGHHLGLWLGLDLNHEIKNLLLGPIP
jgi:hypothetical protein